MVWSKFIIVKIGSKACPSNTVMKLSVSYDPKSEEFHDSTESLLPSGDERHEVYLLRNVMWRNKTLCFWFSLLEFQTAGSWLGSRRFSKSPDVYPDYCCDFPACATSGWETQIKVSGMQDPVTGYHKFNTKFKFPSLLGYDAVLIGSYRRCGRTCLHI